VLCEECSRGAVALDDARREVVSRLGERNVTSEERRPDPAPPVGRNGCHPRDAGDPAHPEKHGRRDGLAAHIAQEQGDLGIEGASR